MIFRVWLIKALSYFTISSKVKTLILFLMYPLSIYGLYSSWEQMLLIIVILHLSNIYKDELFF